MKRRTGRVVFRIGFVVLLADGALAIWLGQVTGSGGMLVVGLALLAAAAGLHSAFRRWQRALEEVDTARRELQAEIGALRSAAAAARREQGSRG